MRMAMQKYLIFYLCYLNLRWSFLLIYVKCVEIVCLNLYLRLVFNSNKCMRNLATHRSWGCCLSSNSKNGKIWILEFRCVDPQIRMYSTISTRDNMQLNWRLFDLNAWSVWASGLWLRILTSPMLWELVNKDVSWR